VTAATKNVIGQDSLQRNVNSTSEKTVSVDLDAFYALMTEDPSGKNVGKVANVVNVLLSEPLSCVLLEEMLKKLECVARVTAKRQLTFTALEDGRTYWLDAELEVEDIAETAPELIKRYLGPCREAKLPTRVEIKSPNRYSLDVSTKTLTHNLEKQLNGAPRAKASKNGKHPAGTRTSYAFRKSLLRSTEDSSSNVRVLVTFLSGYKEEWETSYDKGSCDWFRVRRPKETANELPLLIFSVERYLAELRLNGRAGTRTLPAPIGAVNWLANFVHITSADLGTNK